MNVNDKRRAGRHPGKMPGGMKLTDCVTELESVFGRMTISDRDRTTRAFKGMSGIAAGMPFHDPAARDPYVDDWYLKEAAHEAIGAALISGQLPAWTDYNGQFVELDHSVMFGPNKWNQSHTIKSGTYVVLNAFHGRDGETRGECDGATLWVRADDWPRIRSELIERREKMFGSELGDDWAQLFDSLSIGSGPASTGSAVSASLDGPYWTLHEAVAWLISENDLLVLEQKQKLTDYADRARIAGTVAWLRLENRFSRSELDGARERLRASCEEGSVSATGISASRGPRQPIPTADFTNVELWPGYGGQLHRVVGGNPEPARWLDLRFAVSGVRAITNTVPASSSAAVVAPQAQRDSDDLLTPERKPVSPMTFREWVEDCNKAGWSQGKIVEEAPMAFSDHTVPGRPSIRDIDAKARIKLGLAPRRRGAPTRGDAT